MNLATKDISYSLGKFIVTAMGVGMLLGIVLIMMGVYKGMMIDTQILINDIAPDLWIVQEDTLGPFAESSRVHEDLRDSIRAIDGIEKAEAITLQNIQLPKKPTPLRVVAVGYDPFGAISAINPKRLVSGRVLQKDHYEIVVTDKTGYRLGDTIPLIRHSYKVVGITHGTVSNGGLPLVFISLKDAQELQFSYSNNRIRNDRNRGLKNSERFMVNAVVANIKPGFATKEVARHIQKTLHKSVYTQEQERDLLLHNVIKMAAKQIGMFTIILIIVSTIIIALIIYTMTLEKLKEITIMKLIGLPNGTIVRMIFQETLILGLLAFVFANIFAHLIYDKFPKRVVLEDYDALKLFIIVVIASIFASLAGIKKVISADPTEALGG